ncbi:putative polygalacturonase [Ananas comosus]|uniref:Putative polygalacturonase n=1 Tax=Ananas comosus TaxID=4615 RepID=A0A199VI39_ANACO|nr:putative polygalacturonase [Ananas comosus]
MPPMHHPSAAAAAMDKVTTPPPPPDRKVFYLSEFGGVGDDAALNTDAFERAVREIERVGGGKLVVEPGVWLTAPFNLTSHMTLYLTEGAVIKGVTDKDLWPLMPPLPSYGQGRELSGARYGSLIHGQYLQNVVITGENGTIDGQGQAWWTAFSEKRLKHTRGPLVQLMWSRDIVISNITLRNSPFWTLHPYDCKNVTISNVTILAPVSKAPNTDGIDPDSCDGMIIENCYITVGDDGIAIKSGWDQYGIQYGKPSKNIIIRDVVLRTTVSAGVSIGSEMSGGISNITLENILVWDSRRGVRIKTAPGRGGYIRNITYRNITITNSLVGVLIITDYPEHPDGFDYSAVPIIENISFDGLYGKDVRMAVRLKGSELIPVKGVSFRNVNTHIKYKGKKPFQCSYIEGRGVLPIHPQPCESLDLYDKKGNLVKLGVFENASHTEDYF